MDRVALRHRRIASWLYRCYAMPPHIHSEWNLLPAGPGPLRVAGRPNPGATRGHGPEPAVAAAGQVRSSNPYRDCQEHLAQSRHLRQAISRATTRGQKSALTMAGVPLTSPAPAVRFSSSVVWRQESAASCANCHAIALTSTPCKTSLLTPPRRHRARASHGHVGAKTSTFSPPAS